MKKFNLWAILLLTFILSIVPNCIVNAKEENNKNLYNEKLKTVQVFNSSGKSFYVTNNDIKLMAKVVYAESCGEPYKGKVAVASVILNRMKNPSFPNSIEEVVKQKYAFSCVKNGEINCPSNKDCYKAVFEALDGKDPTFNSLFFYNPNTATSTWVKKIKKQSINQIGRHVFFNVSK